MEVILLQDIPGIGKKNDVLVVGDGYALNNLLPHRKALVATPTVRKRYAEAIRRRAEEKMREKEVADSAVSALAGKKLTFERKITKTGKLYAAITEKHLAEALEKQLQITAKESAITIPESIKALGMFTIQVDLSGTPADLAVEVKAEK
ncbi:50S ribosomal protein L9 [Candidatus Peribacteria bacterium RIFCSPHIGHO2_02_FULL_53_20]|nr:MAG: 50S ribosomal protein L9 [Candidatus Peribacteria bacterium RIFCSPHIGHO2_02_FULL_53_20]OGJ66671.1 MAG: 50S ribosomal protein L9 [Candidatus Peribacteria bacterium RIFCSPLOWO2_01_FULL_53_10]OGJ69610.1 MAG: 50S ribosomal protein L9 [Candidatus Peribacteria bacterium RIFCSPLOWO2_12_FULL_53_10]